MGDGFLQFVYLLGQNSLGYIGNWVALQDLGTVDNTLKVQSQQYEMGIRKKLPTLSIYFEIMKGRGEFCIRLLATAMTNQ